MTAIHQLLPVFTVGDAVSGAAREMERVLHQLGFASSIYAETIDQRISRDALDAGRLPRDIKPSDVVIYHMSIGSRLTDTWAHLTSRRVLFYHNITPAHYFQNVSARVTRDLVVGRDKLAYAADAADLCIAASSYNLSELLALGARSGVVVPPPVDFSRLSPQPAKPSKVPTLLFVGRLAPNKRQDRLLLILKALRETSHPGARLILAGGQDDTELYVTALRFLARDLGISGAVTIPETRISDAQLRDYYSSADILVCASEHEGFCMPLLEAMAFSIPVVALDAGAVGETVGNGGVILQTQDPLVWAEVITRVLGDDDLRAQLIASGLQRVADFATPKIAVQMAAALKSIGVG
jgi:glycosyltransferase involved in cell wall biosynthesis